jgi:predicted nucleotidyltransferase
MREILAFTKQIAEEYSPQRIILFGSYARGNPGPDSDVDLLVILPGKANAAEKGVDIRLKFRPRFPLDLLIRTPSMVRERLAMGDCFKKEIVTRGEVLYEAHRA